MVEAYTANIKWKDASVTQCGEVARESLCISRSAWTGT